jgi:hypothetical protein
MYTFKHTAQWPSREICEQGGITQSYQICVSHKFWIFSFLQTILQLSKFSIQSLFLQYKITNSLHTGEKTNFLKS